MKNSILILFLWFICFISCKNIDYQEVRVWNYKQASFDNSEDQQQKNGITISLEPLKAGLYFKYPELFKFDSVAIPNPLKNANIIYPASAGGSWVHTFCYGDYFFIGFKVKISNASKKPLNLNNSSWQYISLDNQKTSSIVLMGNPNLEKSDANNWLPASYLQKDSSLIYLITQHESIYEKTRKRNEIPYPIGLGAEVIRQNMKSYNLIGKKELQIIGNENLEGILFFPVLLNNQKFKIEVNLEGNSYLFNFKQDMGSVWLNKNKESWVEGKPESDLEYFDPKENKWKFKK